jgi:hypothetical protein
LKAQIFALAFDRLTSGSWVWFVLVGTWTMVMNLTTYKIATLPQTFNLTDGPAFRRWFAAEEAIIDRSAQLFRNNNRRQQVEIEREYTRDFSQLARQTWNEDALGYLMCFTASMALVGEGLQFPQ